MCLSLLKRDYDDIEAHMLVQECFHALGFKSELVLKVRTELNQTKAKNRLLEQQMAPAAAPVDPAQADCDDDGTGARPEDRAP